MNTDEYYMKIALNEAKKAIPKEEVPVGCIIVKDDIVIAKAHNKKEIDKIATYHAEILAINKACKKLNTWHLEDCILYTTLEPCMMCTGAISQARIKTVVYGTSNEAFGYISKASELKINIRKGILESSCQKLLTNFFITQRKRKK